jgi:Amt family ammonium transporter
MKNVMDISIGSQAWWPIGFTLNVRHRRGGFRNLSDAGPAITVMGLMDVTIFQLVLCRNSGDIVSGAMAERTKVFGYWLTGTDLRVHLPDQRTGSGLACTASRLFHEAL